MVVHEKYNQPIRDDFPSSYKTIIRQVIVECINKIIAEDKVGYFSGQTPNSSLIYYYI